MVSVYIICLIYLIAAYAWLILMDIRRSRYQSAAFLIVIFATAGYLAIIRATNIEEAVLALKITYLAGSFLPLTYLFVIAETAAVNIPKWVRFLTMACQAFVFYVVCGIGYNTYFYKDVTLHHMANGDAYLTKVYGPLHVLYPGTMYIYLAFGFLILFYGLRHNEQVYKRYIRIMLGFATLTIITYVIQKRLHLLYDLMPLAYSFLISGTLVPIYYSNLYTVTENRHIISEQLERAGFITFDWRLHYRGANAHAKAILPELNHYALGQSIHDPSSELEQIMGYVHAYQNTGKPKRSGKDRRAEETAYQSEPLIKELHLGENIYDASIHRLTNYRNSTIGYMIELRDETEHYEAINLQNRYNEELGQKVYEQTEHIRNMQEKTILGMAQMVESRDLSTGGHIKRTSDVVRIFADKLLKADIGLDKHFLNLVIRSAPMHDLGKISVDDAILRKRGRYTEEEYEIMKHHAASGAKIVREVLTDLQEEDFVQVAEHVAHYHHEKYNGTGYPDHLKGEEIPIEARIMALADVFDALVSKRCYKDAYTYDKAFTIIKEDTGSHFDPVLAPIFLSCRTELEAYYNESEQEEE